MKSKKLKTQLKKYLSKTASPAEVYIIESWYESFENDPEECDSFKNPKILQTIQKDIFANSLGKDLRKKAFVYNIKLFKLVASVLLAIAVAIYIQQVKYDTKPLTIQSENQFQAVQTEFGQTKEITLSDGTIITMNANSEIRILNDFNINNRKILLDGEAFFQVARDTMSPFIVETSGLSVHVLGTSFNLKSREEINLETLQVYTGKVRVENQSKSLGVLQSERQLIYDKKTNQAIYSEMPEKKEPNWKAGHIILSDASFQELKSEFFNSYGIHLKSENREVLSKKYNIILRSSRTVDESADVLCEIIDKKYRKEGENIIIY